MPPFFLYDGSMLLLKLSNSADDRAIALRAIARSDPKDVVPAEYLFAVHALAFKGMDTSDAALNILKDPRFTAIIPAHALSLPQDFCLIYMLLPIDENYYVNKVISRFNGEIDETAMASLLHILWYSDTSYGNAIIKATSLDQTKPDGIRKLASILLDADRKYHELTGSELEKVSSRNEISSKLDYNELKAKRCEVMKSISDESLEALGDITALIKSKREPF